jgi:uncharacterized protein
VEPDAVEIRVLGCLIEKQRTTPDAYPLTLNSLRLACNQSTNRDPVVEYDESTIRGALERLGRRKWTTLASWANRRAMKYRHTLDSALGLSDAEIALLCVLMLRGPQTPGELKQRSERLHAFAGLAELEATLGGLVDRELAARLPRRPGQREERFMQLLGGSAEPPPAAAAEPGVGAAEPAVGAPEPAATAAEPAVSAPPPTTTIHAAGPTPVEPSAAMPAPAADGLERRVARLEDELASLRADLRALREELGAG